MATVFQEAEAVYLRKMSLPQYAAYQGCESAQEHLFEDCLAEALAARNLEERYG